MNRKVFVSMLSLCVFFLVGLYVAKIFFPQEFVMVIENEQLVAIGAFIDNNIILKYMVAFCTSFIVYWLFVGASTRKLIPNKWELIAIFVSIILTQISSIIDPDFMSYISVVSMFGIPTLSNASLKDTTIVYATHGFSQILSLKIRGLAMYLTSVNSIVCLFLTGECYLWLTLMYIIFNYPTERNEENGNLGTPLLRQIFLLREEEGEGAEENSEAPRED